MSNAPRASRTAVLVCQGRAAGDGQIAPGRFADPTAARLLRPDELEPVRWVRAANPPRQRRQRIDYEWVRSIAELVVPRTVAIDDAVRTPVNPQLVILGAGLDGRAWRMTELSTVAVFEVDQPASQRDKRERAATLTGRPPGYVPVDFRHDRLDQRLAAAGHHADRPTTWVWEGVVPYLTRPQVADTVEAVASCSAAGSRLIVNYHLPAPAIAVGQLAVRALAATTGVRTMFADEPWRSSWTPDAMAKLLGRHGYSVIRDESLLEAADALAMHVRHRRSLGNGRVLVATAGPT